MKPSLLPAPKSLVVLAASLALTPALLANSPTTLEAGKLYVTPHFSYQSFDEFYAGGQKGPNPGGEDIERTSYRVYLDYGIATHWSIDLNVGFFQTESASVGPFTDGDQSGLADTYLGVRRALATQVDQGFDLSVRLGATIPGNYETGQLSASGDDAYGMDLKLLAGRSFGLTRLEGGLGYAVNEGAVPEAWSVGLKVIQTVGPVFIDAGYRYFAADGDLDIGGPGFTPARLREVSEQGEVIEVGVAICDSGGRYYRVFGSQLIDGENIGREQTLGVSVSLGF